jgi:hypothetical protein
MRPYLLTVEVKDTLAVTPVLSDEVIEVEAVVDILCNRCGKSIVVERSKSKGALVEALWDEKAKLSANWGYNSSRDGEQWNADLCEDCADKVRALIDSGDGPGVEIQQNF